MLQSGRYGLDHVANVGACSRYRMALAIRDSLDRSRVVIDAVSSDRFPLRAPRGCSEALHSVKLELLGMTMRPWDQALDEYATHVVAPVLGAAA